MTLTFKAATSPWDNNHGVAFNGIWVQSLSLWIAVGAPSGSNGAHIATSPDGIVWTQRFLPVVPVNDNTAVHDVCWAPALGLLVAVGGSSVTSTNVWTSPDGINWTAAAAVSGLGTLVTVEWSPSLGLLVVGGGHNLVPSVIATSPDTTTWTVQTTPWDNGAGCPCPSPPGTYGTGSASRVVWSPTLGLFVVVGAYPFASGFCNCQTQTIMTSPDGAAWTVRTNPWGAGPFAESAAWVSSLGKVFAVASIGALVVPGALTSTDGTTWSDAGSPASFGPGRIGVGEGVYGVRLVMVGSNHVTEWDSSSYVDQALGTGSWQFGAWSHAQDRFVVGGQQSTNALWYSAPTVTTGSGSGSCSSATLNGIVEPDTLDSTAHWYFEYGTTTAYGSTTAGGLVSGSSSAAVSESIVGLVAGTTYHFRVNLVVGGTTFHGLDATFVEGACPPAPYLHGYVELGAP